jgi:TRAP-type uncharacterized transport system fused permease subunit
MNSEEKVLVDPETGTQRIMLIFYGLMCGCYVRGRHRYAEKYLGYWLAHLLAGIYFLLPILLLVFYKRTIKWLPSRSAYISVYSIIWITLSQIRLARLSKRILGP